jgi:CBS domain-containing protein
MDQTIEMVLNAKGRHVHSIQANQSVYDAIAEMDALNVGALIVMDGQSVVGIVTERDYLRKVILKGRSSKETRAALIMSRDLVTVSPSDTLNYAMLLMTEHRCRHLPVFRDGELEGLVSVGDLLKAMISEKEFVIQMLEDYIWHR